MHELRGLEPWIASAAVLASTLLGVPIVKRLVSRHVLDWKLRGTRFAALLPIACNFLFVVGFRAALDFAPLSPKVERWGDGAVTVLGIVVFMLLVREALVLLLELGIEVAERRNGAALAQSFGPLLRNLITFFVFTMGAIMVLRHFDYDVLSLLTALGFGSFAIGLASKETLTNMISGFILVLDRNLMPGDRINLGGMIGDVHDIGIRSTRLFMPDGNLLIVPNSDLVNSKILNLSLPSREVLCESTFKLPYAEDFDRVRTLCLDILKRLPELEEGRVSTRDPAVQLVDLSQGAQTVKATFWAKDFATSGRALSAFNERALSAMKTAGVRVWEAPALVHSAR